MASPVPHRNRSAAGWLAATVAALMAVVLIHAFVAGDIAREGSTLLSMPWGIVSLAEVYAGIFLFAGWIVHRERSRAVAVAWIALICIAGNLLAALYVLLALRTSGGDPHAFWMGAANSDPKRP